MSRELRGNLRIARGIALVSARRRRRSLRRMALHNQAQGREAADAAERTWGAGRHRAGYAEGVIQGSAVTLSRCGVDTQTALFMDLHTRPFL